MDLSHGVNSTRKENDARHSRVVKVCFPRFCTATKYPSKGKLIPHKRGCEIQNIICRRRTCRNLEMCVYITRGRAVKCISAPVDVVLYSRVMRTTAEWLCYWIWCSLTSLVTFRVVHGSTGWYRLYHVRIYHIYLGDETTYLGGKYHISYIMYSNACSKYNIVLHSTS